MADEVTPLPRVGDVFTDAHDPSRTCRISWHPSDGVFVLSIWHGERCVGTFRLNVISCRHSSARWLLRSLERSRRPQLCLGAEAARQSLVIEINSRAHAGVAAVQQKRRRHRQLVAI